MTTHFCDLLDNIQIGLAASPLPLLKKRYSSFGPITDVHDETKAQSSYRSRNAFNRRSLSGSEISPASWRATYFPLAASQPFISARVRPWFSWRKIRIRGS